MTPLLILGAIIIVISSLLSRTFINRFTLRRPMAKLGDGNPNEKLMLVFGFGVVMSWVVIAAGASYFSLVEQRDVSDSQLTVIGLLGGPALLIITSVLDLFKGKETAKINVLPDRLSADVNSTDAQKAHTRTMQQIQLKHDLEMEALRQAHELRMDAFNTTNDKKEAEMPKKSK